MATNTQGLTAQQMGALAQKQMEDATVAKAMSNPNTLVTGGQGGPLAPLSAPSTQTFQAMTQTNPVTTAQPSPQAAPMYFDPVAGKNVTGDINAVKPWEKYGLQTQAAYYNTDPNTLKSLAAQRAAPMGTSTATGQASIPPGRTTITADVGTRMATDLGGDLTTRETSLNDQRLAQVNALRAQQMEEEKAIRDRFNANRAVLTAQQGEEDKTQAALSYRLGRKDTPYGVAEMADLNSKQALAQNDLSAQEAALIQQSKQALAKGEYQASLDMRDEADRIAQRKIQQQQLDMQKRTQVREEQKLVQEQGKDVFNALALAGKEPSQELFDWYDSSIGVSGVGQGIYEAVVAEKARADVKDAQEAQAADIAAASSLINVLQKIPVGESVTIGGNSYMGMERGEVKTGTETDAQGNVTFWEYDGASKKVKKTSLGNIGKPQDGWTTVQTDQGAFSYNTKTKQYVPLQPGEAKKTWQALFPDGSQSPFRDASDPMQGQCAAFLNDLYGKKILGNDYDQKEAVLGKYAVAREEVRPGDTFLMTSGTTGHVGIISDVTAGPDGKKVVSFLESNMVPPGGGVISTTRTPMSIDDPRLTMFARVPTPNLPPAGTDSSVTTGLSKGLTIGGKPVSEMFAEGGTDIANFTSGYMSGELKINEIPMEMRGDVIAAAKAKGYTGKPAETPIELIRPRKLEDFAKEYEAMVAQDPSRTSLRPGEIEAAYEEDKAFRTSVKQTYDAIKRGRLTKAEKDEFVIQAQEALRDGDIDSVENIATQVALKGMSAVQQDSYQGALNLVESYTYGMNLLSQMTDDEGFVKSTGSVKSIIEDKKKKLGVNVDSRYLELEQLLSTFQNEYRKSISGASLTPQEIVESNKVLANVAEATPRDLWDKMNQGRKIQQFAADARVATTLGMPRPKLSDYLKD